MFDLTGRVVAMVGAGSGIGRASALACARQGAAVACLDIQAEEAKRVAEAIQDEGGEAWAGSVDIRNHGQVDAALDAAHRELGGLHGVVCTPGFNVRKPILDYTPEEFHKVVDVNLLGTFNVLRSGARILKAAGGGSIVLYGSIRAQVVEPGQSVYAATKAGVVQLARTAAAEMGGMGIRVNTLCPGVVETPLTAPIKAHEDWYQAYATKNALGRWGRPDELAGPTVFLLSDASSYMTGAVLFVDGGWTAIDGRFSPPGMGASGGVMASGTMAAPAASPTASQTTSDGTAPPEEGR
ncbi:MAG: SDR family NAD(P)-dependent oxidoreductase [Gemmatimonadota bacterium]